MRLTHAFDGGVLIQRRWLGLPIGLLLAVGACTVENTNPQDGTGVIPSGTAGSSTPGAGAGVGGSGTPGAGASNVGNGGQGQPQGGAASMAGSPGTSGSAGAPAGGAGGGNSTDGDTLPLRPLKADPNTAANQQITFTATQLDPMAGSSTPDTHAGSQEHGVVDTKKPLKGKLVMTLGGIGGCCGQGGIGGFTVGLGFHEMAIAMLTTNEKMPQMYKDAAKNNPNDAEANRQMGDSRMEAWDGKDRVDWLNINEHDSFAYRAALGLKYLQDQDPGGDWAYFLNADGSVRWSDVYLVGYSYGSQTLAVVSKYVRIGRGIATSGPGNEGFPNATWLKQVSATPLDRMYGLYGSNNLDTYEATATAAGWLAPAVNVSGGQTLADLMGGHQFILAGQGHSEFCAGDGGQWKVLCTYALGG